MAGHPPKRRPAVKDPVAHIIIDSRAAAIDAVERWSRSRLLSLPDEHRSPVVSHLITRLNEFGVKVPPLWFDILTNPTKYSHMAMDVLGIAPDLVLTEDESPDPRPTADAEHDLGHFAS